MRSFLPLLLAIGIVACASAQDSSSDGEGQGGGGGSSTPPPAATTDPSVTPASDPPLEPCKGGVTETCSAYAERSYCVVSLTGHREWKTEKCGAGCFAGKCAPDACVDECALGETSTRGRARAGCGTSKAKRLRRCVAGDEHARSRARLRRRLRDDEPEVRAGRATSTTRSVARDGRQYSGYRDAAMWTGSALAARRGDSRATVRPTPNAGCRRS